MVEVVTDTFDRAWWRTYGATLAQRFAQDTIHVRALPVEVPDAEPHRTMAEPGPAKKVKR